MASGSVQFKSTNLMKAGTGKPSAAKSRRGRYTDYGDLPV